MNSRARILTGLIGTFLAVMFLAGTVDAQTTQGQERWLHVRVECTDGKGDTVHVNVPVDLAVAVLGSVNDEHLHHGHVSIGHADLDGADLHAMIQAIRNARDGEFVTVNSRDSDVRVAKQANTLIVHAVDHHEGKNSQNVEVRVPMTVVDALLAPGNNELDVVGAIRALAASGATELVNVKDGSNTVHVWLDSSNTGA